VGGSTLSEDDSVALALYPQRLAWLPRGLSWCAPRRGRAFEGWHHPFSRFLAQRFHVCERSLKGVPIGLRRAAGPARPAAIFAAFAS
jgi:hypothetical protein